MTLSDIASIGSLISSAAVTASLIYLGLQVRQGERNQRALMQQGRANRVTEMNVAMASHPEVAAIWSKGARNPGDLTAEELDAFMMLMRAAFLSGEDSYLQHQGGLLDQTAYESYVAGAHFVLSNPGLRAGWIMLRPSFRGGYVEFMDRVARETAAAARGAPVMERWREAVASDLVTGVKAVA